MPALLVEISRFIDEHQPGFVECTMVDAFGQSHSFQEKVPIVSTEDLWSSSTYPRAGSIRCAIEEEWSDAEGRQLIRVNTEHPWGVESMTGQRQFTVFSSQLALE